jgi:hypothetical protein
MNKYYWNFKNWVGATALTQLYLGLPLHNVAVKRYDALMNQDQSIQVALKKQTDLKEKLYTT